MAQEKTTKQLLAEAVRQEEDDSWAVLCPITDGSCGTRAGGGDQSFYSAGWPTKKIAQARLEEHLADHRGEGPASSLEEFREKHGLGVHPDGRRAVVTIKDL